KLLFKPLPNANKIHTRVVTKKIAIQIMAGVNIIKPAKNRDTYKNAKREIERILKEKIKKNEG
ncbi:MAG: hypothetical protein ACPG49_04050, partial [Chitinophagales bacterium]